MNDEELNDYIIIMIEDSIQYGWIAAPCVECGELVRCEPDAKEAWCENCELVCKVKGLAVLGMI